MSYKQDCRLETIKRLYGSYPVRTEIIINDCIDLNFSLNCLNFLWLTTSSSSYESSILFTNLVIDQKQNFSVQIGRILLIVSETFSRVIGSSLLSG